MKSMIRCGPAVAVTAFSPPAASALGFELAAACAWIDQPASNTNGAAAPFTYCLLLCPRAGCTAANSRWDSDISAATSYARTASELTVTRDFCFALLFAFWKSASPATLSPTFKSSSESPEADPVE